ncbi:unnamed protein product [Rotaria sp. Silwood2]|nr:unnamed protein product [Rotaria sp. Silwood2]
MNRSIVNIMNLPDEIILIIWNKLNKIDALYSFLNVNRRFDKLIRDKIYTCSIELIKTNFEEEDNCSLSDQILDRFCLDILPQIHYIVEQLILESFSMERILYAGDYPRLYASHFAHIFKKQIMHLVVLIDDTESRSYNDLRINIFQRIFALFTTQRDLGFGQSSKLLHPVLTFNDLSEKKLFFVNYYEFAYQCKLIQ